MVTLSPDLLRRLRRPALFGLSASSSSSSRSTFRSPRSAPRRWRSGRPPRADLDLEIGSASPAFGLGVVFHDILVRTRPATGKPTRFTIESARLSVSPWSLLSSSKTITVSLEAFGGHIDITQTGAPGRRGRSSSRSAPATSG